MSRFQLCVSKKKLKLKLKKKKKNEKKGKKLSLKRVIFRSLNITSKKQLERVAFRNQN